MLKINFSRKLLILFWLASAITLVALTITGPAWWDTQVYSTAVQSVHRDGDPYSEGINAQQAFHDQVVKDPHARPPMTYVYSPMTLPLLYLLGHLPPCLLAFGFYSALCAGFVLQLWAGYQMATKQERRWLVYLLPAVAYFPGFLSDDVILSGNIAYLIYGLVLAAAVSGWKRNQWSWYYAAVLAASLCKAPLLSLLALPVLLGKGQWLRTIFTGSIGLGLFVLQAKLWPVLFDEYLRAVRLQFDWNSDFGFSPAGVLGQNLQENHLPFTIPVQLCYLGFAVILLPLMIWAARKARTSETTYSLWLPTALTGTILLNPRVKEYDIAAITVPMLLIIARFTRYALPAGCAYLQRLRNTKNLPDQPALRRARVETLPAPPWNVLYTFIGAFGWFLVANFGAATGPWKPTELIILLFSTASGLWTVIYAARYSSQHRCIVPANIVELSAS